MSESEVIALMQSSGSEDEWNANCDRVKAAHGGHYPDYWYSAVIVSGLLARVCEKWPQ